MGRWAMYRRRGTSLAPAGILILSIVNSGNDQDFFVTLSTPFSAASITSIGDLLIGGEAAASASQDDADTIQVTTLNPTSPGGAWDLEGPFSATTPLIYPQFGTY